MHSKWPEILLCTTPMLQHLTKKWLYTYNYLPLLTALLQILSNCKVLPYLPMATAQHYRIYTHSNCAILPHLPIVTNSTVTSTHSIVTSTHSTVTFSHNNCTALSYLLITLSHLRIALPYLLTATAHRSNTSNAVNPPHCTLWYAGVCGTEHQGEQDLTGIPAHTDTAKRSTVLVHWEAKLLTCVPAHTDTAKRSTVLVHWKAKLVNVRTCTHWHS